MPIHLSDLDVVSQTAGLSSALIVPCNMCPAVSVAVRDEKPFLQLSRILLGSAPFKKYIRQLQLQLEERGIKTKVFQSNLYHQWLLCTWTSRRRKKLQRRAKGYDAVIVLGCPSATDTVRKVVESTDCKVIEGMEVAGIMNAKLSFRLPCDVFFEDCRIFPIAHQSPTKAMPG